MCLERERVRGRVYRERERETEREMEMCFEIENEGVCVAIERVSGEIERSVRGERKRGRDSVCRMIEMCL